MDKNEIKKARQLLGLNQTDFAAQLGWTTKKQVVNLECGHKQPQVQTLLAIECLLNRIGKLGEWQD